MIDHRKNTGFSMMEVLITIVILTFGLLGLAGLQAKALTTQMESYQRSQALILIKDMENRINANHNAATCYNITNAGTGAPYFGSGSTLSTPAVATCAAAIQGVYPSLSANIATAAATTAAADMQAWHNALLGAAETRSGSNIGAMIGARGCITQTVALAPNVPAQYVVAVAWQGLSATVTPGIKCGTGQYGAADAVRRVVAIPINVADVVN